MNPLSLVCNRHSFLLVSGLLASIVLAAPAQAQATTGRIHGQVRDQSTGKPVSAVDVRLVGTDLAAVTTERGMFVIRDVPAGTYRIRAERLGYSPNVGTIELRPGAILEVGINVATKVIPLDSVEVDVRSGKLSEAGFYDRRDTGGLSGKFVTADDIEHRRAAQMTDMFVGMQGVKVLPLGPGRVTIRFNRNVPEQGSIGGKRTYAMQSGNNGGCEPDLYVDGRLFRFSSPPITTDGRGTSFGATVNKVDDFNAIPLNDIAGIEVYVGAAVPPFVPATACGVVIVWLKR